MGNNVKCVYSHTILETSENLYFSCSTHSTYLRYGLMGKNHIGISCSWQLEGLLTIYILGNNAIEKFVYKINSENFSRTFELLYTYDCFVWVYMSDANTV